MVFNDAMEEMELALKQVLDYVMSASSVASYGNSVSSVPKLISKKKPQKCPNNDYVESLLGNYIKSCVISQFEFKLPPPKQTQKQL
jgi:hypothetical protein